MDAFAELGLRRRLALRPGEVREQFQRLSRTLHPDAGGEAGGSQRLAEAAAILESPSRRLRHWAELGGIVVPSGIGSMDGDLAGLFVEIAALLANASAARKAREAASTAISRAMASRAVLVAQEAVLAAQAIILDRLAAALRDMESIEAAHALDPAVIGQLAARLAYLEKWHRELRDALAPLV